MLILDGVQAQSPKTESPDLTKQPTLYVVGYAHLDTQWRWDYVRTIGEFIPKTMRENFAHFEKYPNYIFNFSGSRRYQMMKEYYPDEYAKVKQYVAAGRWFPSGSSVDETDVNSPTAESIIRQILYGSQFFRREFGRTSAEYMLPDCFGFPASLPSILAHVGIKGFSTQKLSPAWQPGALVGGPGSVENTPAGIPFNVGFWEGPDGIGVIAALNPGSYNGDVRHDLSKSPPPADPNVRNAPVDWPSRIELNGKVSGLLTDYHYYGIGDTGGSPREHSIELVERIITKGTAVFPRPQPFAGRGQQQTPTEEPTEVRVGDGPLKIISATAEQMFLDILKTGKIDRLPRYKGDLELIQHSAGSLTSQAYVKRWNRKNELLADAAEKASVAAQLLGGRPYPQQRLNNAWTLVLGSQMHDNLPGTAIPKAYEYVWNDQVLALNQFAAVLGSATESVASSLDTQTRGTAIVVYNPLNIEREDVVEATVKFTTGVPRAVRVIGPDGREAPAQVVGEKDGAAQIIFLAKTPSVGFAVYDVQPAQAPPASVLKVTESSLENGRYIVKLDQTGDVSSVFDKKLDKELLSAPIRLAIKTDIPYDWPAWNMDWEDQQKPPRTYVSSPAKVRIVENGPARVALEVERETEGSTFVQTIRLSAGDAGNRVEFGQVMDWKIKASNLKVTFPLAASNERATYNWDIGTVERPTAFDRQFEVASHQWIDLTDKNGAFGATILTDCKYGSDKSDDRTINLTLVRTPGIGGGNGWAYNDQTSQDWGRHELVYGLAGHAGDWRREQTDWHGQRLNQPLIAFESPKHRGALGKNVSLLKVSSNRLRVLALKKAEDSDEVIVRLVELDGRPQQNVRIAFAAPLTAAREVNGLEQPVGSASVTKGEMVTDFGPYQPRTFAVGLATITANEAEPHSQPVTLPYDLSVASQDRTKSVGGFDAAGRALAAEMLPDEIPYSGIRFKLGPADKPNAVVARGQTISLPAGRFTRLYLLAASADGDQKATFRIGNQPVELTIQDWGGYIGQWDNRILDIRQEQMPPPPNAPPGAQPRRRTVWEYKGLTPGFIKRAPVAWFASHRHTADGANEIYAYSYLFAYSIEAPANARTLTLPNNDKIRILAVTVANEGGHLRPAQPLYDTLERPSGGH
jgi:alpha-mannosidase